MKRSELPEFLRNVCKGYTSESSNRYSPEFTKALEKLMPEWVTKSRRIPLPPPGYWTKERCSRAIKGLTRSQAQQQCRGAYTSALRNGWLDEFCGGTTRPRKYWTMELIHSEARKHKTPKAFNAAAPNAVAAARRLGCYAVVTAHMLKLVNRKQQYTREYCASILSHCISREDADRKHGSMMQWLRKNGWVDLLPPKKKTGLRSRFTREKCAELVRNSGCANRTQFAKRYVGAFNRIRKMGWLDLLPPKKKPGRTSRFTRAKCAELVRRSGCTNRTQFSMKHSAAAQQMRKMGWQDLFPLFVPHRLRMASKKAA